MKNYKSNINIKGNRITITPVKIEDSSIYFKEFNEEITKYQFAEPFKSLDEAKSLINNFIELRHENISEMLTITDELNNFIGSVEVYNLYSEYPEVGIWICKEKRNRGYGKEALEIIKSHLIENNDIKGLIYEADIRNEPSLKLIQKLNSLKVEYNEVTDNGKTLKLEKYILI